MKAGNAQHVAALLGCASLARTTLTLTPSLFLTLALTPTLTPTPTLALTQALTLALALALTLSPSRRAADREVVEMVRQP